MLFGSLPALSPENSVTPPPGEMRPILSAFTSVNHIPLVPLAMPRGAPPGEIPVKNSVLVGAGGAIRPSVKAACDAPRAAGSDATEAGAFEHPPTALTKAIAAVASAYRSL